MSSESESEEEAEYHPNVSVSISHTQIPEEKEEELEQEVEKEEKRAEPDTAEPDTAAPDATPAPAEVSQPVEATGREEEEPEAAKKNTEEEEEKEEEKEVAGSADAPADLSEEAPNGVTLSEEAASLSAEGATTVPAPAQEEEEPKMNGEASLAEAESRPQVICCSEVKSSPGPPPRGVSLGFDPSSRFSRTRLFLLPASLSGSSFLPV